MSVTKDSFRDWISNPVTKAVFATLADKIGEAKEHLGNTAGVDPSHDRFMVGIIQAYMTVLGIDFDEVSNGN